MLPRVIGCGFAAALLSMAPTRSSAEEPRLSAVRPHTEVARATHDEPSAIFASTPRSQRSGRSGRGWLWVVAGVAVSAAVIAMSVGIAHAIQEDHDPSDLRGEDGRISYTLVAR